MVTVNTPPRWQAHSARDYDSRMLQRCDALLVDITSNRIRRQNILANPRSLHRELFADFTPSGYPEYAGTYRGTTSTSLEKRSIGSSSAFNPSKSYNFTDPQDVEAAMSALLEDIRSALANRGTDYENLFRASRAFGQLGSIHPFLDGNGHVQRAVFAAMVMEFGYQLNRRFAIHPRPFDTVLAMMLELFTTTGQKDVETPLLAEYLGYFVDGPFEAVRGTLTPGNLY